MNRLYVILILIGLVIPTIGCNKQRSTNVEILDIIDSSNNTQIMSVNIFISDTKIAGRDKDDFYGWEIKPPVNIPIEINRCTYILVEAEGYNDWEEEICPNRKGHIQFKINLDPELIPSPRQHT